MTHFTKEIHFLQQGLIGNEVKYIPSAVIAHFKELSRTDMEQHKLAMRITSTFRKFKFEKLPNDKVKVELDDEAVYDLTVMFINTMSIYTNEYDEQVKNEILADSGAIYTFGMWVLSEKIAPFFRNLHES